MDTSGGVRAETGRAVRNAIKLGASLVFTWGIALAVRFYLPRHLGPDVFGALNFADAFAATAFVAIGFGIDTWTRKEVSVRRDRASHMFAGVVVARVAVSVLVYGGMALVLHAMRRPPEVQRLVFLYGTAQIFVSMNSTLSALLHTAGRVDGSSILAVVTKVIWAVGIFGSLLLHMHLYWIPASYFASEFTETWVLYWLCRRHVGLRFELDLPATFAVLRESLPFFVNVAAISIYAKLDVSLLAGKASNREVGWYGAASSLAGIAMLVSPLIGWVVMPMMARAAARSREELLALTRRCCEMVLVVAVPVTLGCLVAANECIHLVFGDAYAPAAAALRVLAPMFPLTYFTIVYATSLNLLTSGWRVTLISICALGVNTTLNLTLISPMLHALGPGGGGAGCSLSMICTEVFTVSALMYSLGRGAISAQIVGSFVRYVVACAATLAVDFTLRRAGMGGARWLLEGAVYLTIAIGTGAIRPSEVKLLYRLASHREPAEPPSIAAA